MLRRILALMMLLSGALAEECIKFAFKELEEGTVFEMDINDGEIRYKNAIDVEAVDMDESTIEHL